MTIEQKIERLETALQEVKKELSESKSKTWILRNGDSVYKVGSGGNVSSVIWSDTNKYLNTLLKRGRIFKAREKAEFFSERELLRIELQTLSDDKQEWNGYNSHYYFYYDCDAKEIAVEIKSYSLCDVPHFKSEESVKSAIEKVGADRIKKYLFGVGN